MWPRIEKDMMDKTQVCCNSSLTDKNDIWKVLTVYQVQESREKRIKGRCNTSSFESQIFERQTEHTFNCALYSAPLQEKLSSTPTAWPREPI